MSYKEGEHPLFPYTLEEKQKVREEYGLTENSITQDVDAILEWFKKQPHLSHNGPPDRDFVERMIVGAKGSREKAKSRIDNLYKYRHLAPELIQNREEVFQGYGSFYHESMLPKMYELKRVSVVQFYDPDPNSLHIETLYKSSIMMTDIRMKYDYSLADIWVIDIEKAGIMHLLRLNSLVAHKASKILQECYGLRIHSIHFLGAPSFGKQIVNFFKMFIKPKILERVVFHDSHEDLHKVLPKKYLPKDYGGEQISMAEFKENYVKLLSETESREYALKCSREVSDETKRVNYISGEEYMPGSFKTLNVD